MIACKAGDIEGPEEDGKLSSKVFEVTDLQVKSYDTSDDAVPIYSSVATMLFGTFPTDPLAIQYTVEYINPNAPAFEATASWSGLNIGGVREPVPDVFAVGKDIVPGYVDGVVGPDYFIRIAGSGCQSGVGGPCEPGTESTLNTESNLRAFGGKLKVTIDYE
jgi:hypothetical protein